MRGTQVQVVFQRQGTREEEEMSIREQKGPLACTLHVYVLLGLCCLCKDVRCGCVLEGLFP